MKNDCMFDLLFWDHLLEQNRSYQYIERGEGGGEIEILRENLKNDCILDFLFWDHLLEQNRSYQYIERGERREEKQRH